MTALTADRVGIGMITPSSNTVLEPMTTAMLAGLPEVSAHFARLRVLEISMNERALGQFDRTPMLDAAGLLADAKVDVIAWNGTSSSWLGFDKDEALCHAIEAETGVKAASSVLALNEVLQATGVRRLGLVTPYLADIQERIIANYAGLGIEITGERHLDDRGNWSFATYDEEQITGLIREVAAAKPDAITILCTNFRGAPVVAELERELGLPIYDSVATALWKSLALAGVATSRVEGWGSLFART